ncbi:MAG: outer membrane beta-barrel protein [Candidatus Didemnitutus sp.]|nr:outer membrane beta-barrel protein [Candidatus Didemnitutus sp.]
MPRLSRSANDLRKLEPKRFMGIRAGIQPGPQLDGKLEAQPINDKEDYGLDTEISLYLSDQLKFVGLFSLHLHLRTPMKTNLRILLLTALTSISLNAAPFMALGDNAELFLTATASVTVDDNIYLRNTNEVDDMIFTFEPGVDLVFGRNALTSGNFYYRHKILRYSDVSAQDTDLVNVGFNSLYNNGKSKVDVGASYTETAQNEPSAPGAIVPLNLTNIRALGEVGATEKTSIGAGVRYDNSDYQLGGSYRDSEIWSVPVDVYFEYSPKLELSLGYRYRSTDLSGTAIDNKDHFASIGARGEFTPKLVGQVRVGYAKRNFSSTLADQNSIGIESNLTYAFSPKTNYLIGVTNDFGNSATGDSTETLSFNFGANSKFDEQWSWNANVVFRSVDYPTRTDNYFEGGFGVSYTYSAFVNFTASVKHSKQSADSAAFEFSNNVFSIGANIRY